MKNRISRAFLTAAGVLALAGTPALFAGDLHRDYAHVARQNADIRRNQWRLHEDMEHGRYWQAARERADIERDRRARNAQVRDIRRDEYERWR